MVIKGLIDTFDRFDSYLTVIDALSALSRLFLVIKQLFRVYLQLAQDIFPDGVATVWRLAVHIHGNMIQIRGNNDVVCTSTTEPLRSLT